MIIEYQMNPDWLWSLIFIGYLEMHYRFRFFPFSRYFRREPEILADAPHRLNPGQPLPVTILIKDAHRFPITLLDVRLVLTDDNGGKIVTEKKYSRRLTDPWFEDIITIATGELTDPVTIAADIAYRINGRPKCVRNHNVPTSPAFPLLTTIAAEPLPGATEYFWGDLHYHSSFTEDFVEFGAPLTATRSAAAALGLDFVAVSDHSYDLDNTNDSWKINDPELQKWRRSRTEIAALNTSAGLLLLPAEEVTVRNARGRNVHLLVYNHADFIAGSGDGAEVWGQNRSEHDIAGVLKLLGPDALAIAAHPGVVTPPLEWLLIRRGRWEQADRSTAGLAGFQIVNGAWDRGAHRGLRHWIRLLLSGRRTTIVAGNDAHGNFNHFHQIGLPMVSTRHHGDQILGRWRTGVLRSGELTAGNILTGIRRGRCIVSDGPALLLTAVTDREYSLGDVIPGGQFTLLAECRSSVEFGALRELLVYHGHIGDTSEKLVLTRHWSDGQFRTETKQALDFPRGSGYLRAALTTTSGRRCLSNPIWIEND
ncbi:MAG: CehA/McbA family metallohydrolase [Candidatus Neomarinimicrobiota bacterium]